MNFERRILMNIDNKAWFTLYQDDFNRDGYLYHFTSIEKAALILDSKSLKFSKITSTNDTLEAKPKMSYKNISSNENLKKIFDEINKINRKYIQLLCFSKDNKIEKKSNSQITSLSDYSGRGFALPRMWAQYAHNNDGVCFVFNKSTLLRTIHNELGANLICENNINYVSQYTPFDFDYEEAFEFLLNTNSEMTKCMRFADFLKHNLTFTNYNYFCKLDDWENENEFRILAYSDENFFINNINTALVGVIIGEHIKPTDEKIVKFFCKDVCEVKKIDFSYNGCGLENIYDD